MATRPTARTLRPHATSHLPPATSHQPIPTVSGRRRRVRHHHRDCGYSSGFGWCPVAATDNPGSWLTGSHRLGCRRRCWVASRPCFGCPTNHCCCAAGRCRCGRRKRCWGGRRATLSGGCRSMVVPGRSVPDWPDCDRCSAGYAAGCPPGPRPETQHGTRPETLPAVRESSHAGSRHGTWPDPTSRHGNRVASPTPHPTRHRRSSSRWSTRTRSSSQTRGSSVHESPR